MGFLRIEGLVLLEDCFECDGEQLLASLVLDTARGSRFSGVCILLLGTNKRCFVHKYPALLEERIEIIEVETVDEFFNLLLMKANASGTNVIFIDTVTHLLTTEKFDETIRLLKFTARNGRAVLVRIFTEELSNVLSRKLYYTADGFMKLRNSSGNLPLCTFTFLRKTGKRITKMKTFGISDRLRLTMTNYESGGNDTEIRSSSEIVSSSLHFSNVSFDLGLRLTENEREAKQSVNLPYLAAQSESVVNANLLGKRKIRAGGRIIYTPDDGDDLDDSDPDDDLEI
uniref:Elongator complex protein 5 n=1 Tax=Syphacia muris TaxID=451379 RepID=A0A0N5AYW9_9BILA